MSHIDEVMVIFLWDLLPILAKICLPWQCPLDLCSRKCLIWIGWSLKPYQNQTVCQ